MVMPRILVFGNDRYASRIIRWVLEYKGYQTKAVFRSEAAMAALVKRNMTWLWPSPARGTAVACES